MTEDVSGALPEGEVLPENAQTAEEQHADPAPAEQQEDSKPKVDPAERRINRLTAEKYRERARAEAAERELAYLRQQQAPQQQQARDDGPPKLEQFDSFDRYLEARDTWVTDRATRNAADAVNGHLTQRQQAQMQQQMQERFSTRLREFQSSTPDFEEVIESGDFIPTPAMTQAIFESDIGPRIAYYLAQHSEEAQAITRMSPTAAIRALGRIEAKLEAEPVKKPVSAAPKPVEPVSGKGQATKDPDKMSTDEWLKWRNAQLRNR